MKNEAPKTITTWYRGGGWRHAVEPVQVVGETDKTITELTTWNGHTTETRRPKETSDSAVFRTWTEARDYVRARVEQRLAGLEDQLAYQRKELDAINALTPPDGAA